MIPITRIQAQLRASARLNFEVEAIPPFTCFFNPDDSSPWSNYAIPDENINQTLTAEGEEVIQALAALAEAFQARNRVPRFEYLADFAPDLAGILDSQGYEVEMEAHLMVCTPEDYQVAAPVESLRLAQVTEASPLTDIQAFVTVQRRSFGQADAPEASLDEAQQFRRRFGQTQLFMGWWEDEAVSVGALLPVYEGIAEIAGIATLPAYRRRGVAAALTAFILQMGFEQGLEALFLTVAEANAGRVYERVGFQPAGAALAYYKPG